MVSIDVYDTYAREQHHKLIQAARASRILLHQDNANKSGDRKTLRLITWLRQRFPTSAISDSGQTSSKANTKTHIATG